MFDSSKVLRDLESQIMTKKYIAEQAKKAGTGIKVVSEKDQRNRLMELARAQGHGVEIELQNLFAKYDNLLRNCTNQKEKAHIAYLGVEECARLLNTSEDLVVNGYVIKANANIDYETANKIIIK